jgi:DNA invertase Pin-like site-specific DNA recombinase
MNTSIQQLLQDRQITSLYAYSRKSRDDTGEGLQKHYDVLRAFAEEQGLPIEILEEVGSSETLSRPMLTQVREKVRAKQIRCLVIYRIDRLSRKVTDTERLIKEFAFHDLVLIEAHNNRVFNYKDYIGNKLNFVMNDLYLEQAKEVLNAGKMKAVSLYGNHIGEAPLGYLYDKNTKKLTPDPETIHIIQECFSLYLSGLNLFELAVELNQRGYRTKDGNIFTHKTVGDILHNTKYIGTQTYGKTMSYKDEFGRVISQKAPESEWIVYPHAHEALVSDEDFDKAQQVLKSKAKVDSNIKRHTYGLTGLIKCGVCGRNITFYQRTDSKDQKKLFMKPCANIDFTTGKRCVTSACALEAVDKFINDKLWYEVKPALAYLDTIDKVDSVSTGNAKAKTLASEKQEINKKINNILELQISRGVDQRLIDKENELKYRLQQIDRELEALSDEENDDTWFTDAHKLSLDFFVVPFKWKSEDHTIRNKTLLKYIQSITYSYTKADRQPKMQITYTETVQRALDAYKNHREELTKKLEQRKSQTTA